MRQVSPLIRCRDARIELLDEQGNVYASGMLRDYLENGWSVEAVLTSDQ